MTGSRQTGSNVEPMPTMWDHDIFASNAWYLETRLPGPQRTTHSPFRMANHAAAREWMSFMDYFRFPAVGHFVSAAELFSNFGTGFHQEGGLVAVSRKMRAFNDQEVLHSTQQWK